MLPSTRYTQSGNASIAYQVAGEGPLDLLFVTGWVTQLEQLWEWPSNRRLLERLTEFSRLIMFDSRGTGLSERGVLEDYTLEQEARDAIAVLDAAGSERAALFTYAQGGLVGALLAAEHAERIGALIMYASLARTAWAPDYEWALTIPEREAISERIVSTWGEVDPSWLAQWAPSCADDPALAAWFARLQRLAASPGEARVISGAMVDLDVREALARIHVPTLVMHRPEERVWDVRHSHYLASNIEGARYVELGGIDSLPFVGDTDAIVEEVEEFLTGVRFGGQRTRELMTVLFTDIVDSTAHAARLGDGRWRDLLAGHDARMRTELARYAGREVKTVGDGFLATFAGPPSGALRCALALSRAARELGVEVRIGMHTGECELIGEDVGGMAVHIAARVSALAGAGEVLVSGTVFGTVVGGPFTFEDRGFHELKGVPGSWPLFALMP
ncbi:MAG TPA: adenylate/guanylate cyclase domain-containing protein [Solirubrobacteraceae bacterium]|jgi:class 3 adenylate cyclase|nr:adenylate/guanylate cyclase domain-containing protein [Solirubrobacteraceae bacterium]